MLGVMTDEGGNTLGLASFGPREINAGWLDRHEVVYKKEGVDFLAQPLEAHAATETRVPASSGDATGVTPDAAGSPATGITETIGTPPREVKENDEDITEDRGAARPMMGTATAAKRAPFSGTPAETARGRKLLRRIQADTAGDKVGPRSINQFLGELTNSPLLVGKTQTSARNPAHYRRQYHIIRSRSGAWQLDFHEYGHALSAILRDRVKGWVRGLGGDMLAIAQMPGSMASAQSVEEGVAEFVRRYIVDPTSMAPDTVTRMEDAIRSVSPSLLAGLRDAHRLWAAHAARSIPAQLRSYTTDRPPLASVGERVKDLWASTLYLGPDHGRYLSVVNATHRVRWELYKRKI